MEKDLTGGSVLKNIIRFSLPYLASYFLQTFYGLADLFITGQFNGADVITAVSNGSQIMHFVTVFIVGISVGTTVMIAHGVGARNREQIERSIGGTVTVFAVVAAVLTLVLLFFSKGIVGIIQTPEESRQAMQTYIMICFAGIPFITAYNTIAAVFRGLGDSKTPMLFILIACVLNIALDYLFIGAFSMGAAGAALGTVISQTASVLFSLFLITHRDMGIHITKKDLIPDREILKGLIYVGMPIACQDGFIQVSFLVITAIANSRGVEIAAAVGITEKIITFLFLVPSSMMSTISAVGAQCIGAELYDRAKKTLFVGMGIACSIGIIFAVIFQTASEEVLSAFTDDAEVVRYGAQYLKAYVTDCFFASIHFCFSGYFSACSLSIWSFLHNAISIVTVRIPGAYFASRMYPDTLYPMGLAAPMGSLLSAVICVIVYIYIQRNLSQSKSIKEA